MERPQIKSPQIEGLKNFLVQLPAQFTDYEIRDLSSSIEFRRIAQAIKICNKEQQQQQQNQGQSQSLEKYNFSCVAQTICPTVSKHFFQCWRQAQMNPGLNCEIQRRGVETCVGEHISQAIYAIDSGRLSSPGFDNDDEQEKTL